MIIALRYEVLRFGLVSLEKNVKFHCAHVVHTQWQNARNKSKTLYTINLDELSYGANRRLYLKVCVTHFIAISFKSYGNTCVLSLVNLKYYHMPIIGHFLTVSSTLPWQWANVLITMSCYVSRSQNMCMCVYVWQIKTVKRYALNEWKQKKVQTSTAVDKNSFRIL